MHDPARFAGIIYPDVLQMNDLIPPMLDTMRGGLKPIRDIHTYRNVQFGSVGAKILYNDKKTIFATFDGMIENGAELEKEIGKPAGDNPAQLLIWAYERWQEDCIAKIEGDFAFAIYDTEEQLLLLARDRIGKKPLYWYHDQHHLIFGSELKSLLASGIVPQTADLNAIAMYLYFGFIPQDMSPIKDVNKLLPASFLLFQPGQGRSIHHYWSYSYYFEKKQTDEPKVVTQKISTLLENASKKLLQTRKGNTGCFITGGIGSATVAWELSRLATEPPMGYTVDFSGQSEEDTQIANEVAKTVNMPLKSSTITPDSLAKNLVSIVWSLDEPIADPTIVATWNLSEMAAQGTKTVFSGMGSDEFLAGHNRYTNVEQEMGFINRLNLIPGPILRRVIVPLLHRFSPAAALNILKVYRTNPWQFEFLRHNAIFDEHKMREAAPKLARHFDPDTFLHKFHHMSRISSSVAQLLYLDVKTRLPDHFMLQYERLTKAHGLSWRSPFLDRELVEYAAGLPEPEVLLESTTASYLKPLIAPIFSPNIVARPKRSRPSFLNTWTTLPEVHNLFQYLLRGTLIETGIISEAWLREQLFGEGISQRNFRLLWSILILEIWFHLFINRPIRALPITKDLHELLSEL